MTAKIIAFTGQRKTAETQHHGAYIGPNGEKLWGCRSAAECEAVERYRHIVLSGWLVFMTSRQRHRFHAFNIEDLDADSLEGYRGYVALIEQDTPHLVNDTARKRAKNKALDGGNR